MSHLSFHAGTEGKIKKSDIKKATGHTFRKTEQRYKTHKNKEIDQSKTHLNIDTIRGNKKLEDLVDLRLEKEYKGKRALRKDAVVVREIIAQPSADYFDGMDDIAKQALIREFAKDSMPWFEKEFGKKNVLGLSAHMDETNPHVHFAVMPMTDDGRISQKDFFKSPADLKRMHREYREHMNAKGWEFDLENKNEKADGIGLEDYKRNAEAIEAQRAELTDLRRLAKDDTRIQDEAKQELKLTYMPKIKARLEKQNETTLKDEREALKKEKEELKAEKLVVIKARQQLERFKDMQQRIRELITNSRGTDFQKDAVLTYLDTGEKIPNSYLVDSNVKSVLSTQQIINDHDDALER